MRKALLCAGFLLASAVGAGDAFAVEINVLSAGAVQEAEKALAEDFREATGNKVNFTVGTVGQIQEKLKSGAPADVIVVSTTALEQLEKTGEIRSKSGTSLGRIGIGVGVKEGAPTPDISTAEKFKEAILRAKSLTYMDPAQGASSGIATAKILRDLGIAEDVAKKTKLTQSGYSADRVASGEVELAIQNVSEIVPVKGVKLAGMLPAPLQVYTTYAAGVATKSISPKEATDFIRFLARAEAAGRWKEAGIEPAH
ncbi:MAG TPA: substrate-binding domain-containing protein [Micropepsaceae bacterium]|nr:substrate-binding domain-containing protein [Micropepsaceae bacterium]